MKIFENLIYAVVILFCSTTVTSFELFSTLGVGLSVGGAVLYAGFDKIRCPFVECCDDKWIPLNFNRLETSLRDELFGQHLTQKIVVAALRGHFREVANPKKALALSFHGYPGSGKTFVSHFIKDNVYKLGSKSKFAHFFAGRIDFAVAENTDIYKINLMDWIRGNVTQCPMSLFVFDEVDKMPSGVLDAIKPFLDYHEEINGVDYRKAVFIFLSNTGSSLIVQRLLDLWQKGIKREDIKLRDFEDLIRQGAFNENGGFNNSDTIESDLIDHYIPFLPLEESHVRQCIKAEFRRQNMLSPTEEHVREILKDLTFGPEPHNLYSNSGCKRIGSKVTALIYKLRFEL